MLYFDQYGNIENPTILLLHGAGALDTFSNQYYLSEKYHLVIAHLHGAGKSVSVAYDPNAIKHELFELIKYLNKDKIGVIGHSLGAQIAIGLVCEHQELFNFAIFLSAWVNPKPSTVKSYCRFSTITANIIHWKWLIRLQGKYWNFTKQQADYMAEYSKQIIPNVYKSFFTNTLELSKLPAYKSVAIPMYAICGSKEVKDMKTSLDILAENPYCETLILNGANHYFPMRNAKELNQILEKIICKYV